MMYQEFCDLLNDRQEPTFEEYTDIIELVYNYHPLFQTTLMTKERIAKLYDLMGLDLLSEMAYKARAFKSLDQLDSALESIQDAIGKIMVESDDKDANWIKNRSKLVLDKAVSNLKEWEI